MYAYPNIYLTDYLNNINLTTKGATQTMTFEAFIQKISAA